MQPPVQIPLEDVKFVQYLNAFFPQTFYWACRTVLSLWICISRSCLLSLWCLLIILTWLTSCMVLCKHTLWLTALSTRGVTWPASSQPAPYWRLLSSFVMLFQKEEAWICAEPRQVWMVLSSEESFGLKRLLSGLILILFFPLQFLLHWSKTLPSLA